MYTTINEELRIQSCGIEDILLEEPKSITVTYDQETDNVIINQNHPDYDIIQPLTIKYLRSDFSQQKSIRENAERIAGDKIKGVFHLLDQVMQIREQSILQKRISDNLHIIGQQTAFHDEYDMINAICEDNGSNDFWTAALGYSWGYIQGIRSERARRKKVAR
jgi:hypothetical protein